MNVHTTQVPGESAQYNGWSGAELLEIIRRRDVMIDRLKAENEITVSVCNENIDLKKLITELADALVTEEIMSNEGDELIQRAREATK
jgi:hypothetical protein